MKEEQLYSYIQSDQGEPLSAQNYHDIKSFLKLLRYLKVIKKYEYKIRSQKQIAYILIDEKTYSSLFPDYSKDYLACHHATQNIINFNRRMVLDWENASRV